MEFFTDALDSWFPRVLVQSPNSELFAEMIEIELLGDLVVARLEKVENSWDGQNWYHDKELIGLFDKLYKCGCISLPSDPVDRIRWIALGCVAFSRERQFSYGNVIIPHDYIPENDLENYEDWGYYLIEDVQSFRSELKEKGWNWLVEPA